MTKRPQNEFRTVASLALTAVLFGIVLTGCRGASPTPPVQQPEHTPTLEVIPTPDLDLADQYLVVGITEGESIYLKAEPGGADPAGSLPFGTTGIQPTGEIRKIHSQIWIEVTQEKIAGWVPFKNLAAQYGDLPAELVKLAHQTTAEIRDKDYQSIGSRIHPELCLRFSPYAYLNPDNRILCQEDLEKIDPNQVLLWGHYDGTGLPINLTFQEYHQSFVYDQDYFQAPILGLNLEVSSGNAINNIAEIYPDGMMVEYYFPGIDPQYGGLDWRSLRLVFVNLDGSWYLTAIIHGEWTI